MSMISPQRTASTRWAAVTQNARATVPRLRRRCCARAPHWNNSSTANGGPTVLRQTDRASRDLRRPGGDRDRKRAPVQRSPGREARIRRLVDSNIIGIFVSGFCGGGSSEANDAFLEMLGYGHDDVISGRMRWTKLTPTEWAPADADALASAEAGPEPADLTRRSIAAKTAAASQFWSAAHFSRESQTRGLSLSST